MEPLSLLANLLLSVTIGTLMVALVAFLAYKLRESRKPSSRGVVDAVEDETPVFLRRYVPDPEQLPARGRRPSSSRPDQP